MEHDHDWRIDPFADLPQTAIGLKQERLVCADDGCDALFMRPSMAHPVNPKTWPKAQA